jgi:hypothetical protein
MRSKFPLLFALLSFAASGGGGAAVSSGGGGGHGGGFHGGGGAGNLGHGSFSHALGTHAAAPATAENAIALRAAPTTTGHKPEHHYPALRHVAAHQMNALFGYCAAANYDLNNSASRYGFHCGGAIKAPINPETGQPVG